MVPMGRQSLGESAQTEVCAVRLTRKAVTEMDALRGSLSRSEWIRKLVLDERKRRRGE